MNKKQRKSSRKRNANRAYVKRSHQMSQQVSAAKQFMKAINSASRTPQKTGSGGDR